MKKLLLNEENANSATHFVGLCLSLVGLFVLIYFALKSGNKIRLVAFIIYGLSLILLYGASFVYHSVKDKNRKRIAEILDHSAIFVLIAGTYTPYTLVSLQGTLGIVLFIIIWSLAIIGVAFKLFFTGRFKLLSTAIYLVMGWLAVIAIKPLIGVVPDSGIKLLITGGIIYTVGVVFYLWKGLHYHHALWHLFVLGGSIAHYFSILFYV